MNWAILREVQADSVQAEKCKKIESFIGAKNDKIVVEIGCWNDYNISCLNYSFSKEKIIWI